jgi:hypothetical protein
VKGQPEVNDSYTDWQRRQHDADGGFAAALASGHERAATVLRNLPDNLLAVATTQYVFAATGYYDDRKAAVDAWAAAHHVTAGWLDGTGYCARLEGPLTVVVIAAGVEAFPVTGQDAPRLVAA